MSRTGTALVVIALVTAIGSAGSAAAQPAPSSTYVVVLKPGTSDVAGAAAALARAHGGTVGFVYTHALRGFSVRLPAAGAAAIARNPAVAYVEADQAYTVTAQSLPTGIQRVFAPDNPAIAIDGADDKRVDVDVAVIDTGIQLDHPDLNVVGSTNCVTFFATCGSGGSDGNGHGTHVAGTIGALDNGIGVVGVAPGARLWSVRVLNNSGTGTTSQIIAGMDWVTARASTIEVANLSLSGGASASIDSAANRMADAGIAVAVAAGNNDADAAGYSPARATKVLTVSAMADYDGLPGALSAPPSSFCLDQDDTLADFSNWGSTVEITAPGCRILSTYPTSGYAWINGTSMASPHVAGALGLLASNGFSRTWAGVSTLYSTLVGAGNHNWTDDSGDGIQEPLLDVHDQSLFNPKLVDVGASASESAADGVVHLLVHGARVLLHRIRVRYGRDDCLALVGLRRRGVRHRSGGVAHVRVRRHLRRHPDGDGRRRRDGKQLPERDGHSAPVVSVSLQGSRVSTGSRWNASVLVTVTQNGSPTSATVSWAWSNGASGSGTCAATPCTVTKTGIRNSTHSVTFTVNSVAGSSSFGGTKSIVVTAP